LGILGNIGRAMPADKTEQRRPHGRLAMLVVPILAGILLDGASELLKLFAHGITTQLKDYLQWHIGSLSDLFVAPVALGFCLVLLVPATWLLERFVDPRPWVRNVLLVLSLVIVGGLEPWTLFQRNQILHAYNGVYDKEPLADVLQAMDESPLTITPHEDGVRNPPKSYIYCEQDCWLRLTYSVPSLWRTGFVEIDFDSHQEEKRKDRIY
jgi:hypothetical protein